MVLFVMVNWKPFGSWRMLEEICHRHNTGVLRTNKLNLFLSLLDVKPIGYKRETQGDKKCSLY